MYVLGLDILKDLLKILEFYKVFISRFGFMDMLYKKEFLNFINDSGLRVKR